MFWAGVICIILLIVIFFRKINKAAQSYSSMPLNSTDDTEAIPSEKPVENTAVALAGYLNEAIYRYFGAIQAIREANSDSHSSQKGSLTISLQADGKYHIDGFYDHFSDYGVLNALEYGGYLDYPGLQYREDGFSYHVGELIDASAAYANPPAVLAILRQRLPEAIIEETPLTLQPDIKVYINFHF